MQNVSSRHKSSLWSFFESALEKISDLTGKNFDHLFGLDKNSSGDKEPSSEDSNNISSQEFISAITHELKTPLSAIIAFSEVLKDEIRDPQAIQECMDHINEINRTAVDLNDLVHDLLDVSQINSGKFSVNLENEIDIADAIHRAMRINHDYALKRRISLKADICDNLKPINLDNKRMKQVLTNLISNAVKYSPKKTEVSVSAKLVKDEDNLESMEIKVADHGYGMDQEQIKDALAKYKTVNNPNRDKVDSFGLGLPIVKQLVELQNGKIEIISQVEKGTEFILKFPYKK